MNKLTTIQCDTSTKGLGAILLQEGHPIMSVSRSLTKAEKNYLALELECLAIVFACQKFHHYIYGKRTLVETDHKPLDYKKNLFWLPTEGYRECFLNCNGMIFRSDTDQGSSSESQTSCHVSLWNRLSRTSSAVKRFFTPIRGGMEAQEFNMVDDTDYVHVKDERIEEVRHAAREDEEQELLRVVIADDWPPRIRDIPAGVRCYWNFRDTLTVSGI